MLDECKGERFEEVLAAFSTIVLRKRMAADGGGVSAIARRLALAPDIKPSDQRSLLPLAIAHRASLTAILHRKEQQRSRYLQFQHSLHERSQQLRQQQNRLEENEASAGSNITEQSLQTIRQRFDTHWQGDPRWLDVILNGDAEGTHDALMETPFERTWMDVTSGVLLSTNSNSKQDGLLRNLENRVAAQQERLRNWKRYREQIAGDRKTVASKTSPEKSLEPAQGWSMDFTAHKQIDVQQAEVLRHPVKHTPDGHAAELPQDDEYAQLLKSMQQDLDAISAPNRQSLRHAGGAMSKYHSTDKRRPNYGRYQSQLADSRLNCDEQPEQDDVDSEEAALPEPEQLKQEKKPMSTALVPSETARDNQPSDNLAISTPEPCDNDSDSESQPQAPSSRLTGTTLDEADHVPFENDESMLAAEIIAATMNADPSPIKAKPSLIERTRRSMAFASPVELHQLPLKSIKQTKNQISKPSEVSSILEEDRRTTLLERTRRSMSLLPAQPREPRKSMHKHRHSRQFPTNQFETPKKQPAILEDDEDLTPPEQVFSPDADYESVFKSRPKIAMSPTDSPALDGSFVMDALVDPSGENGHADQWESSPLARIVHKAGL